MLKLKKIKPLFNRIITTAEVYETDQYTANGILDSSKTKGTLKEYQRVVAIGSTVRDLKEGDLVYIDPTRYMVTKHKDKSLKNNIIGDEIVVGYRFNTLLMNDKKYLELYDQDIKFIVEDSEEVAAPKVVLSDKPSLVI